MAQVDPLAWFAVAGLAMALAAALVALWRARRRARVAEAEAERLRGMALDPIGARLMVVDMEIERLGRSG